MQDYAIKKHCVDNWVAECQPVKGRVMHPLLNMSQNKMSQFLKGNNALSNIIWIANHCLTKSTLKSREINVLSYVRDSEHYYTRICSTSSFLVVDGVYALLARILAVVFVCMSLCRSSSPLPKKAKKYSTIRYMKCNNVKHQKEIMRFFSCSRSGFSGENLWRIL